MTVKVVARDAVWSMDATHLGRDVLGHAVQAEVVREVASTRTIGIAVGAQATDEEVVALLEQVAVERGGFPRVLLTDNGGAKVALGASYLRNQSSPDPLSWRACSTSCHPRGDLRYARALLCHHTYPRRPTLDCLTRGKSFLRSTTAPERIWIASPYFVPDEAVMVALQFYRYLDGSLHEKVMLIDDRAATLGTANFDNRSFRLNFEITAVIHDSESAAAVAEMFESDFEKARLMEEAEYEQKSFWFKLGVRLARLTAPVQ